MSSDSFRSITLENSLSELSRARAEIFSFIEGHVSEMDASHIILSVDEALSNIIRHGYGEKSDGLIILDMRLLDSSYEFTLSDTAPLYNPLENTAAQNEPESGASGGFGIGVYLRFMDVRYEINENGGNRLILKWEKKNEVSTESD